MIKNRAQLRKQVRADRRKKRRNTLTPVRFASAGKSYPKYRLPKVLLDLRRNTPIFIRQYTTLHWSGRHNNHFFLAA